MIIFIIFVIIRIANMSVNIQKEDIIKKKTTVKGSNIISCLEKIKKYSNGGGTDENTQVNGKTFENYVKDEFVNIGYVDKTSDRKTVYKKMLTDIRDNYDECLYIQNVYDLQEEKILIQQPYGSQYPPDIILIDITETSIRYQPIEVKTGKKAATWNNTYPKQDWIYIFSGDQGVTYFKGDCLIDTEVRDLFEEYKQMRKELRNRYNEKIRKLNRDWKLIDYFKFEHTGGVNYKQNDKCQERETYVNDTLTRFMNLQITEKKKEDEKTVNKGDDEKVDAKVDEKDSDEEEVSSAPIKK